MRKSIYMLVMLAMILSCKKDDPAKGQSAGALLKLTFWDEFKAQQLDSVHVAFPDLAKSYLVTKANPFIRDLPKQNLNLRMSKEGFIDIEKSYEMNGRDTVNDNIIMRYDDLILTVSTDSLFANYRKKSFLLTAKRNKGFTVDAPNWITVDTVSEHPFEIGINIGVDQNTGSEDRKGVVILKNGESKRIIPVYQYRRNSIESVFATLANTSSYEVNFADPLDEVSHITTSGSICYPTIQSRTLVGRQLNFGAGCAGIYRGITFNIHVKHRGDLDTLQFRFQGYDAKIDLDEYEERLWNFKTFGSDKYLYFTDNEKKRVGVVDLDRFEIERAPTYNFVTRFLAFNPHNQSIYVTSTDNKIRRIDKTNGQVLEEISLPVLSDDYQPSPRNIPEEVQFNKNGFGLITAIANNNSGSNLYSLDTKKNNEIRQVEGYTSVYYYSKLTLMHNEVDFGLNENYGVFFSWSPVNQKFKLYRGYIAIIPYGNLAVKDTKLVNIATDEEIGDLNTYIARYEGKDKAIYAMIEDIQRNTWMAKYDLHAKELYRIPMPYPDYSGGWTLSGDGKYIIYYDYHNNILSRFSTDYFKGKVRLQNWEV